MRNTEFYGVIAILILWSALIITPIALSDLAGITIQNSGKILTTKTPITQISEIRGVFIHEEIYGVSHNWNVIAETLAGYGINAVFVNDQSGGSRRPYNEIRSAINAFHAYGIEYHSSMNVLINWWHSGTEAITSGGSIYASYIHCPKKAHDYVMAHLQDYLETFPDVDGIMLDYIRYEVADMCYCPHCRAAFEEWLGEGPITNWTPFYPSGSRWSEYADWRTLPVTKLVKDMHDLIKSFNPNIIISEAAWTLFSDSAIYWRKWIGQDTAAWIKEGYLDFVAPMMYQRTIYGSGDESLEGRINATLKYWMGGRPEGPISLVALLRAEWTSNDLTPEEFAAQVNYVRSRGLDGWIIWRYSGPGGRLSGAEYDTTDYLDAISLPTVFKLANIATSTSGTSANVTWTTDLPTTSKVEYSISPLFSATWSIQSDFHYWKINYNNGTVISDSANVTAHSITLANLEVGTDYYFRVQSRDESGIVTTKILTFTTKS